MMAVTESDHRPVGFYAAKAPRRSFAYLQANWLSAKRAQIRQLGAIAASESRPGLQVGLKRSWGVIVA